MSNKSAIQSGQHLKVVDVTHASAADPLIVGLQAQAQVPITVKGNGFASVNGEVFLFQGGVTETVPQVVKDLLTNARRL